MGGDKRSLLAIGISILVFIIWYSFIAPKYFPADEVQPAQKIAAEVEKEKPIEPELLKAAAQTESKNIEEVISIIETDEFIVEFTNYGARPKKWILKKYTKKTEDDKYIPIDLIPSEKLAAMPLEIKFEGANFVYPEDAAFALVEDRAGTLKYLWRSKDMSVEKIYTVGKGGYDLDLKVAVKNLSKKSVSGSMMIPWSAPSQPEKSGGFLSFLKRPSDVTSAIYLLNGSVEKETSPGKPGFIEVQTGKLYWSGIEDRYFMSAIAPKGEGDNVGVVIANLDGKGFYTGPVLPKMTLASGGSEDYNFTIFGGPKEMQLLKKVGYEFDKAIDYGWFTFIAIPILYTLKFLYSIFHNYGIAIILLTILIKILLYPISKKSMKSMKGMKDLQPRIKELKEKYGEDKQRLNTEMMQLFKVHKVNPMSGCLPMVLQFPVYIALYRVLWNSIELYQAPFFWFYKDLSAPDPYFITPVLLGVFMFIQQKMTPTATADPAQQKMMMMMPLMFSLFLIFLPVGLVIYILVNTVFTVLQQWMNNNDIRVRDLIRGRFGKQSQTS